MLVGLKTGSATMEKSMESPQKVKTRTTVLSSNPSAGSISKGDENRTERHMGSHGHCSAIHNRQDKETTYCPSTDDWLKKRWYRHNGTLLGLETKGNVAMCNNMDET